MLRAQLFLLFYVAFTFGIWISFSSIKFISSRLFPIWLQNSILAGYSFIFLLSYLSFPLGYFLATYESILKCQMAFLCLGHLIILSVLFTTEVFLINWIIKSRKVIITSTLYILAVILTLDGAIRAFRNPIVNHISLRLDNFPTGLDGLTLVHISDIHIGPTVGREELRTMVRQVNSLLPDLVVISGDLTDLTMARGRDAIRPLSWIQSTFGVYFATGNHDHYVLDMESLKHELLAAGVIPLLNERVEITSGDSEDDWFYLAGLEDISTRQIKDGGHLMDIHNALGGRVKNRTTILIAHQPNAMREALEWGVELILGGHTHGGQFFPVFIPVYLFNPFFAGLYQPTDNTYVYVNTGTFFYMVPIKHWFRREIAVFHLYAK